MEGEYVHALIKYPSELMGIFTTRQKALDRKQQNMRLEMEKSGQPSEYFITTWLLDWSYDCCG